jgi:transcriptional regulator with XRE-family HTH domain
MAARRRKRPAAKRGGGTTRGSGKPGGRKRRGKKPPRPRAAARGRKPRRAARKPAASGVSSLAEWISERVEHAAVGALRRAVEVGGSGLAAWLPEAPEMRREAGAYLRELRELAGLTRGELAEAVELSDRSLLEAAEAGTATLSFGLILRLASILARHDPVPFVSRMARSYNPMLWELLQDWGLSELPLRFEREREFVNVLRGHDEARRLSDEDFAQVLAFTRAAFETALHFAAQRGAGAAARTRSEAAAEQEAAETPPKR